MTSGVRSGMHPPEFLIGRSIRDLTMPTPPEAPPHDGYRFPALIDLHIHGGYGWDFSYGDPDRIEDMLDAFIPTGLTGLVATLITCSEEQRMKALEDIATVAMRRKKPPAIMGICLEGPFLSPARRGSHPEELLLKPDIEAVLRWQRQAYGLIKLVTVAPELPGADLLIEALPHHGIRPAIGHTDADHRTTLQALEAGVDHVTHLFNAMRPFTHRDPSPVSAVFTFHDVMVELIADGIHVSPEIIVMTSSILGPERLVFVSDGVCPLGLPNGEYDAYGTRLEIRDGRCTYVGGHLFGGGRSLVDCISILHDRAGLPLDEIADGVGANPCRVIRAEMPSADVILDRNLRWLATHFNGVWYWRDRT
ncbi:MAG TPA: amidohydrolase family protein [Candidatus Ozemobacteraceae bacterium]